MNDNCCVHCKNVPSSLWIAILGLLLFLMQAGFRFVVNGGTGAFISAMLTAILLGGLFLRQSWSFYMAIVLYFLLFLAGFQAWDYDRLVWLKNAIAGGFVLIPVLLNKDYLAPEADVEF